ncbi:Cupin domain protein [compost metagenome]
MYERLGFNFEGISEDLLNVDLLLSSPHLYGQGLVKYIRHGQSFDLYSQAGYLENMDCPVKVEGMERLNPTLFQNCQRLAQHFGHVGPVSAHLFVSPQDGVSFPMHTDLDDVVIYMVSGRKVFEFPNGQVELVAGDSIHIPRGQLHRAINVDSSVMLSFGLELFLEAKL